MKLTLGPRSGNAKVQTGRSKETHAQATEEFNFVFSEDNLGPSEGMTKSLCVSI